MACPLQARGIMHTRPLWFPLRASRFALNLALLLAGHLLLPAPACAQNFWHVTAQPEIVLGWHPRTVEEAARGPLARRGLAPQRLRASATPFAALDGASAEWHELGPPVRAYHALVYDSRRHRFLQAGGNFVSGQSGSTGLDPRGSIWSFDLQTRDWTEIAQVSWPMSYGVFISDAAYDSLRDRLIVVGHDSSALRVDALPLSGSGGWELLWTSPPRLYASSSVGAGMAIDTRRDVLALRATWNDTSRFVRIPLANPGAWTSEEMPLARVWEPGGGSMVYDSSRDRYYLSLGGYPAVWSLHPTNSNTLQPLDYPEQPYTPIRLALDTAQDRVIGTNSAGITWAVPLSGGEALKLDDRAYPGARWDLGPAFAFDPVGRRLYRSGGARYSASMPVLESVTVDSGLVATPEVPYPVAGAWRAERPLGMGSRLAPWTALDPSSGRIVVAGGMPGFGTDPYSSYAMIRALDGSGGWEPLGTGSAAQPGPTIGPAMTLDPIHHALLVFGGQALDGTARPLADLWSLPLVSGGTWSRLEFPGEVPSARRYPMFFCDQARGRFILMGGDDVSLYLDDAWELRLDPVPGWRRLSVSTTTPFPYGAVFPDPSGGGAWCFSRNRATHLVLDADSIGSDESFELFPDPTEHDSLAFQLAGFDAVSRRFLLLTTEPWLWYTGLSMLDRVWWVSAYPGPPWLEVPIGGRMPQRRDYFSTTFDPDGQRLFITGGYDEDVTYFSDNWALVMPPMLPTPVLASLRFAESDSRGVRLAWLIAAAAAEHALVQRSDDGVSWSDAGAARFSGADELSWNGQPLAPAARVAFRLVVSPGASEWRTEPVWLSGPGAPALALAPRRNPSGPDLALSFTLAAGAPARLRLLDAAGRLVAEAQLEAGTREWSFGRAAAPGLYFAELTQGSLRRVTKLVTLR